MRRLRESYFKLDGLNPYKMKVHVAAKTLNFSVAAALESMVASGQLPNEAIFTAEFAAEIEKLFNSVNSSGEIKSCKPLKRPLCKRSMHIRFWDKIVNTK